ncbi:MAG TPA: hypothetical protein VNZ53_45860 [Steroidobacteraceae bacterium]|nr:hypothetical protein [Steroidobacteraceae bacterium]
MQSQIAFRWQGGILNGGHPVRLGKVHVIIIAGHAARFDALGRLKPWTSWNDALDREMKFYQQCPADHGYPRFVLATFLDGDWTPIPDRTDTIPSTQNGMGILSYLKFHERRGREIPGCLQSACSMGDYLVKESLTPRSGQYPAFTRSTGKRDQFPLEADCGSQADRPYEIEPDKGGIAGYALALLSEAAGERRYLEQALQNARVLAANQQDGDAFHSPWPFRADYRGGEGRGPVSGNMTYILRLYDALLALGFGEFSAPRESLWTWIARHQIPSAAGDGGLFAQFFEDHDTPTNRSAWAPLNLARYLLEKREAIDPEWRADCGALIDFVRGNFTHAEFGITVCHEQDEDHQAWGGINSTYGAVLALYAKAVGSAALADEAQAALDFTLYSIDELGRPRDLFKNPVPGGWQEDAHTDVIHNYEDALRAFPEWGEARV